MSPADHTRTSSTAPDALAGVTRCEECRAPFATDHDWIAELPGTAHARTCSLRLDNLVDPDAARALADAPTATSLGRALRRAALDALAVLAPAASRGELANWLDHDQLPASARHQVDAGRVVARGFRVPTGPNVCAAAALLIGHLADAGEAATAHPTGHAFDVDRRGLRVLRADDAIITLASDDLSQVVVEDLPGHWTSPSGLPADCPDPLRVARWLLRSCGVTGPGRPGR